MKIDLKQLVGTNAVRIPFAETLDLSNEVLYGQKPFQKPTEISGEVSNEFGVLRLKGSVQAVYSTACVRCLKPLEIPLTATVDTILSNDPDAVEEENLFVLTGDSVDLADVFIPALILQVRMTYLCKEDCKGLCPRCGADLNVMQCSCDKTSTDPRFSVLRSLLDRNENG